MTKVLNFLRRNKYTVICFTLAFTGATLFWVGESMVGFFLCSLASAIATEKLK